MYACKTCGRLVDATAGNPPLFCYYDKIQNMEDVPGEHEKAFTPGKFQDIPIFTGFRFEFPGDALFHPLTGDALDFDRTDMKTLSDYQNEVMAEVTGTGA